jgi:hypothetical protein
VKDGIDSVTALRINRKTAKIKNKKKKIKKA